MSVLPCLPSCLARGVRLSVCFSSLVSFHLSPSVCTGARLSRWLSLLFPFIYFSACLAGSCFPVSVHLPASICFPPCLGVSGSPDAFLCLIPFICFLLSPTLADTMKQKPVRFRSLEAGDDGITTFPPLACMRKVPGALEPSHPLCVPLCLPLCPPLCLLSATVCLEV